MNATQECECYTSMRIDAELRKRKRRNANRGDGSEKHFMQLNCLKIKLRNRLKRDQRKRMNDWAQKAYDLRCMHD